MEQSSFKKNSYNKESRSLSSKTTSKKKVNSKPPKSEKSKAMDRADEWFSRYIRIRFSISVETDGEAICKCYTCGKVKKAKYIQNGHWQRREFKTTRFHINDARPQCVYCNKERSGQPEKFEINLIKEIGQEEVDHLKWLSQQIGEDNEIFYREQADKYRKLTNQLIKQLGVKKWW